MAFSLTDNSLPSKTFEFDLNTTRPGFTFDPETTKVPELDFSGLNFDQSFLNTVFMPSNNSTQKTTAFDDIMGDAFTVSLLTKSQEGMFVGAGLKVLGSAVETFNTLMGAADRHRIINQQADNTKIAADNQMKAIDNQVLFNKNQIMDRFTNMVANNTVEMAAKGLRVSAGALLEGTKGAAYDLTQDIQIMESNARLKKISLEATKKQAEVARDLAKSQQWTDIVGSLGKMGLQLGMIEAVTGKSFGDLYTGYKISKAAESGSLNDLY